jgi:hypothetical protein
VAACSRKPSAPPVQASPALASPRIILSPEQRAAIAAIAGFIKDDSRRMFVVHGATGVGKTLLIERLMSHFPDALPAAPVALATIVQARAERSLAGRVLLVDEAHLMTAELRDQLLTAGVRLVAFSDPAQLGPVCGEPGFPKADFVLKTIHPQALTSPIVRQAHAVLTGGDYRPDGPDFRVTPKGSHGDLRQSDIVLCWTNESRRSLTQLCRSVRGVLSPKTAFPRAGEPVVLLRNNPQCGLCAGDIMRLDEDVCPRDPTVTLFQVSESGGSAGGTIYPLSCFEGMSSVFGADDGLQLTFGYCQTVHRAQGHKWPSTLIYDEMAVSNPDHARWLYTALACATERVVIVNRSCR